MVTASSILGEALARAPQTEVMSAYSVMHNVVLDEGRHLSSVLKCQSVVNDDRYCRVRFVTTIGRIEARVSIGIADETDTLFAVSRDYPSSSDSLFAVVSIRFNTPYKLEVIDDQSPNSYNEFKAYEYFETDKNPAKLKENAKEAFAKLKKVVALKFKEASHDCYEASKTNVDIIEKVEASLKSW
jgi:hypothetical protein